MVVEAVKGLFGEEKEEKLLESLTTIINCCDGEKNSILMLLVLKFYSDIFKVTWHSGS